MYEDAARARTSTGSATTDSPRSTRPCAATRTSWRTGCARRARSTPARSDRAIRLRTTTGSVRSKRARLTLERRHLHAQLDGASTRVEVMRAPDAGCSRRRRASAAFPVLYRAPACERRQARFSLAHHARSDDGQRSGAPRGIRSPLAHAARVLVPGRGRHRRRYGCVPLPLLGAPGLRHGRCVDHRALCRDAGYRVRIRLEPRGTPRRGLQQSTARRRGSGGPSGRRLTDRRCSGAVRPGCFCSSTYGGARGRSWVRARHGRRCR
jgi:hypothetical protein